MAPAEIGWRIGQAARTQAERLGFLRAGEPLVVAERAAPRCWFALDPPSIDRQAVIDEAQALIDGRWRVFALHDARLGFPPDWHRDPKSGRRAPQRAFGKAINYRDERQVGDIKYLWEINRHLELVTLAQAWRLSGEPRWLDAIALFVDDWLERSPYPCGINWTSSLELAIRLVNWSVSWHLLGGDEAPLFAGERGQRLRERWLGSIHRHCCFIRHYPSLHSSANNHRLGELMGLFVAACTWPRFAQSLQWQHYARDAFEREALIQNGADGVNREQAVYYQHEVMDMMLVCRAAASASALAFGDEFDRRLCAMAEYLVAITDAGGQVPMLGDADDAMIVRWADAEQRRSPYAPLLAACAVLFERADFKRAAGAFGDKAAWLLGRDGLERWNRIAHGPPRPPRMRFDEGGIHLLGTAFGEAQEVKAVIDCGALGYLGIAAHGHADALSFTLSIAGEQMLVDPGTYAYHTQARWREHFKGTAAHNTVRIDGIDQSEPGGAFLWLRKARSRCLRHEIEGDVQVFEGEHDGYGRLADPVTHRRRIEFDAQRLVIEVVDTFACRAGHAVEICWQFGEGIELHREGDELHAAGERAGLRMRCDAPLALALRRGSEEPIAGWVSRRYDSKTPAWAARWSGRIESGAVVRTRLQLAPLGPASASAVGQCDR